MRQRWVLPLMALLAAPGWADSRYRDVDLPKADVYYGHISYCELKDDALDPRVMRDEVAEPASVNSPLTARDTIATSAERRCEAQFDTGTVLRLDHDTRVKIETILARMATSSDHLTSLQLERGRLRVMYRDYGDNEVFQVLTAHAAVKLGKAAVVDVQHDAVGVTHVSVLRGGALVMFGHDARKTEVRRLKSGERATVTAYDVFVPSTAEPSEAFDLWNEDVNRHFDQLHEGRSALPKPVYNYPLAVINFAQRWSSIHGEWLWSEMYGYVWRPYLARNQGWIPFSQGRWAGVYGRQFWVPDEPWGWVPYHLGLWHWDQKAGWVWIPGSTFAPAWVSWARCGDLRFYRPYSLLDTGYWGYGSGYGWPPWQSYLGGFGFGYGVDGSAWNCGTYAYRTTVARNVVVEPAPAPAPSPSPSASPEPAPKPEPPRPAHVLELPNELKKVAERYAEAVKKGEVNAFQTAEQVQVVGGVAPDAPLRLPSLMDDAIPRNRFRDWNGDVRLARIRGGELRYSRAGNRFECSGCRSPLDGPGNSSFDRSGNSGGGTGSSSGGSSDASSTGSAAPSSGNNARGGERDRIR